jgi:hypothetical protein
MERFDIQYVKSEEAEEAYQLKFWEEFSALRILDDNVDIISVWEKLLEGI